MARALPIRVGVCIALACPSVGYAQVEGELFPGWDIRSTQTTRFDEFDNDGPAGTGPYPFEGTHAYHEFSLSLNKRDREYARWSAQVFGALTAHRYRSLEDGLVPERVNITREVGDTAIPYRWQAGDIFSYFSYMTSQQSVRGLQLELQPTFGGRTDSFIAFIGSHEPQWKDTDLHSDASLGISYLFGQTWLGSTALNLVYNHRERDVRAGFENRSQTVASLAFERDFAVGGQLWTFETEQAYLVGDHDGRTGLGPSSGQNRNGLGSFVELRGRDTRRPLTYRIRGERYEDDFRPRGGVILPDRRSAEAHLGWRFLNGLRIRSRLQAFDLAFQSSNRLEIRTAGINLAGPVLGGFVDGATTSVDLYYEFREDEAKTIDQGMVNFTGSIIAPLGLDSTLRLGTFIQAIDSDVGRDSNTWQVSTAIDHPITIGPLAGVISPGMVVRLLRANVPDANEFAPTLALRIGDDRHSVGFNYGLLLQDRFSGPDALTLDVGTHRVNADYRFRWRGHEFGAEASYYERNPKPGADTEAWNIGVFWTYHFDRPSGARLAAVSAARPAPSSALSGFVGADLVNIAPGKDLEAARALLGTAGITGASRQGDYLVYEHPVFPQLFQRQRLVVGSAAGTVFASGAVIEFDLTGGDDFERSFERVRKALIDRYGPADRIFEEGRFSDALVDDVNAQRFVRIVEWDTPSGTLRFGIPRRRDGRVRMEIQHRAAFGSPTDTLWSFEEIR